jgi:hypothetical protein
MMSFSVSAILPLTPLQPEGSRTEKSPFFKPMRTCRRAAESSPLSSLGGDVLAMVSLLVGAMILYERGLLDRKA